MEATDNDKIALLEFLGNTNPMALMTFNPLDISILLKTIDIIEKKWYTRLDTDEDGKYNFYIGYYDYPEYKGNGSTREEAILKAILAYIKQTKI